MSDEDRQKMSALARDLATLETDEEPTPEARRAAAERADGWRAEHDLPALRDEHDRPELEFYRIARARGLRRIGG